MKVIFTYPPEFDGELHLNVETEGRGKNPTPRALKIELTYRLNDGEGIKDALRALGKDLANRPMRIIG